MKFIRTTDGRFINAAHVASFQVSGRTIFAFFSVSNGEGEMYCEIIDQFVTEAQALQHVELMVQILENCKCECERESCRS